MSKKKRSYMDSTYTWGNIFMVTAICVLVAVPVAICVKFDAWPKIGRASSRERV